MVVLSLKKIFFFLFSISKGPERVLKPLLPRTITHLECSQRWGGLLLSHLSFWGFFMGLLRMDSWYPKGRTWRCSKGPSLQSYQDIQQAGMGTHHVQYSVWATEKRGNKEKTAGREEGLHWMYFTVSYRKPLIYWVWGVEGFNSEFDSHYYFLAWATWALLSAGVICHDVSEGDKDKNSAHIRKTRFFSGHLFNHQLFTLFFPTFLSKCAKGYQNIFIRTVK